MLQPAESTLTEFHLSYMLIFRKIIRIISTALVEQRALVNQELLSLSLPQRVSALSQVCSPAQE
jgi:hypothetical protein